MGDIGSSMMKSWQFDYSDSVELPVACDLGTVRLLFHPCLTGNRRGASTEGGGAFPQACGPVPSVGLLWGKAPGPTGRHGTGAGGRLLADGQRGMAQLTACFAQILVLASWAPWTWGQVGTLLMGFRMRTKAEFPAPLCRAWWEAFSRVLNEKDSNVPSPIGALSLALDGRSGPSV